LCIYVFIIDQEVMDRVGQHADVHTIYVPYRGIWYSPMCTEEALFKIKPGSGSRRGLNVSAVTEKLDLDS
jgi:hypothetical protein